MNKFEKLIMVVKRTILLDKDFEGFKYHKNKNYNQLILDNYEWQKRGLMEEDPSFKQPIAYCAIVNPETKKVFVFQRAKKDKHYTEKRLQGKWSCGIGGHVDHEDEGNNPLWTSMLREIHEEVNVEVIGEPEILGYINSEKDPVSQVHFGILCIVKTTGKVTPNEPEIANGAFRSIDELKQIITEQNVENWTKIALNPLETYFNS